MGNKKQWGVLGKRQTFLSPSDIIKGKEKVPLNQNPFDPWDTKKSRYRRIVGQYPNDEQQSGVVEQPTIGVSPTPSPTTTVTQTPSPSVTQTPSPSVTQTPSPTPSITPSITPSPTPSVTPTLTPSVTQTMTQTPSSTPYPLPIQPTLWFDGSDSSYMTLILSGGNQYVSTWTSKGTNGWVLSGANTDRMPIYSASTLMPGNPNCVRFTTNATSTLQDGLSSFGNTSIQHTGSTWFLVWAKPLGSTYTTSPLITRVYSGFTNGGLVTSGSPGGGIDNHTFNITNGNVITNTYNMYMNLAYGLNIPVYSATNLNDKFISSYNNPGSTNGFSYMELNQSAQTNTTSFTGSTSVGFVNSMSVGFTTNSGGTATYNNSNSELCEVMWFNTELTPAQREQVELYLKDKWRYDEWASPVPTATPTASPTQTTTNTPTPTPSTTPPFNPLTLNPMIWIDFNDSATLSLRSGQFVQAVSNKGNWTAFTGFSQTTAANQPTWSASTMGTGKSAITISNDFMVAPSNLTGSSWNTFAVMKYAGTSPFGLISINGASGRAWSNLYPERNNSRYANYRIDTGGQEYRANFTGFTGFNTTHIVQGYMSNSATTIVDYMTVNNSGLTETITSNSVPSTGFPGSITSPVFRIINVDEFQTPINGEIGEIYMFDKELTSAQQSNLINFLRTKWGIA